jgi:hypothetical protein
VELLNSRTRVLFSQTHACSRIKNCPQKAKSGFPHRLCGGEFSRFGAQAPLGSLISLGIRDQVDQTVGTAADFEVVDRFDRRSGWKYGGRWSAATFILGLLIGLIEMSTSKLAKSRYLRKIEEAKVKP